MNEFDREWLMDILEYARIAVRVLGSADASQVASDEQKFLALTYAIQVVGEAANQLSPEARNSLLPEVAWPKVIGMRHRLVHGYRTRSAEVIVQTVREDLPALVAIIERVVSEQPGETSNG